MDNKSQNSVDHYNSLPRWGKEVNHANRERIEQTLAIVPEGVKLILDIGCGDGTISNFLISDQRKIYGVDVSSVAIKHFRGMGIISSIDNLPFPNKSFDLIICAETLEHLPDGIYEKSLNEITRVAREYIVVSTPNDEYLPVGYVKCDACGFVYHANLHQRSFTSETYQTLFSGFDLLKLVKINNWSHSRILTSLNHFFGYYKFKDGLSCPQCRHVNAKKRGGLPAAISQLNKIIPKRVKARWILSLFRSSTSRYKTRSTS
jgi:SAM-dependent methyltransferase